MKKKYSAPRLAIWVNEAADICTGSPISETGINFSDLFKKSDGTSNFS